MTTEEDLYLDLPDENIGESLSKLESENKILKTQVEELKRALEDAKNIQIENELLRRENDSLKLNASSLLKTARLELQRKEEQYQQRLEDNIRRFRSFDDSRQHRERRESDRKRRHDADRHERSLLSSENIDKKRPLDADRREKRSYSGEDRHRERYYENKRERRSDSKEHKNLEEYRYNRRCRLSIEQSQDINNHHYRRHNRSRDMEPRFREEDRSRLNIQEQINHRYEERITPREEYIRFEKDRNRTNMNLSKSEKFRKSTTVMNYETQSDKYVVFHPEIRSSNLPNGVNVKKPLDRKPTGANNLSVSDLLNGRLATDSNVPLISLKEKNSITAELDCTKMYESSHKTPLKDLKYILSAFQSTIPISPLGITPLHVKEKLDECRSIKVSPVVPLINEHRVFDDDNLEIKVRKCEIEAGEQKNGEFRVSKCENDVKQQNEEIEKSSIEKVSQLMKNITKKSETSLTEGNSSSKPTEIEPAVVLETSHCTKSPIRTDETKISISCDTVRQQGKFNSKRKRIRLV